LRVFPEKSSFFTKKIKKLLATVVVRWRRFLKSLN